MSWIAASLLMFVSSIAFYLSVKKLHVLGVDKRVITLGNYFLPSILFYILSQAQGYGVGLSLAVIGSIFLLRVGFNYVGTLASFKGIGSAPNAGYSLIIQKSYAAYTIFAAALLYGSELSLIRILISMFILACAFVISVDKGKKISAGDYRWVKYSLISFFCFGAISLSSKYFANIGVHAAPQLFWVCVLTLMLTVIDMRRLRQKISLNYSRETWVYMAILGLSVTGFFYFKLTAEVIAPNLGYVGAINSASNAAYTVIVAKVFGDNLSSSKLVAVLAMAAGMAALFWV